MVRLRLRLLRIIFILGSDAKIERMVKLYANLWEFDSSCSLSACHRSQMR